MVMQMDAGIKQWCFCCVEEHRSGVPNPKHLLYGSIRSLAFNFRFRHCFSWVAERCVLPSVGNVSKHVRKRELTARNRIVLCT